MRITFTVILALLGVALARDITPMDGEDEMLQFLECTRQAIDKGLPEAAIPSHNPLIFHENVSFPINMTGVEGSIKLGPLIMDGIVDFEVRELVGKYTDDTENEIRFYYNVYWPKTTFHGEYKADVRALSMVQEFKGTFDFSLNHLFFKGIWQQTLSSPRSLTDFTLELEVTEATVTITGLGQVIDSLINKLATEALTTFINSDSDFIKNTVTPGIQKRIDDLWLADDKWYRVEAIMDYCDKNAIRK